MEGKDVKDLLLNVGSGGGAAAPAAGGAAAGGDAGGAEAAKEEEKEEGTLQLAIPRIKLTLHRKGGVGRRHGIRSLRLDYCHFIYVMNRRGCGCGCILYQLSTPLIELASLFLPLLNQESTSIS